MIKLVARLIAYVTAIVVLLHVVTCALLNAYCGYGFVVHARLDVFNQHLVEVPLMVFSAIVLIYDVVRMVWTSTS